MAKMSKTYKRNDVNVPKRDPWAHIARMRRSAKFHDRRAPRGGSKNDQADLLDQMSDWEDWDEVG